jgi:hypothetical protein
MMATTDWSREPTDASNGTDFVWPWVAGMDDEVAIDLAEQLDAGEAVTDPVVTLARLKSTTEGADADVTAASVVGSPTVSGSVVRQRIDDLAAGRVYRGTLMHGAAGNRRAATFVIDVIGG